MDGIDKTGSAVASKGLASAPSGPSPVQPGSAIPGTAAGADAAIAKASISLLSLLADATPPIDTKKVEAIQSLIASGAYPIDPHAIAAKMLALDFPKTGAHADA